MAVHAFLHNAVLMAAGHILTQGDAETYLLRAQATTALPTASCWLRCVSFSRASAPAAAICPVLKPGKPATLPAVQDTGEGHKFECKDMHHLIGC